MLAAAVHVWARGRSREGAEVEGKGSGGGPGGVPPPKSIKHLSTDGKKYINETKRVVWEMETLLFYYAKDCRCR